MEGVFQQCIREAKEMGKTVFLSSHILAEVERLCDRISIIKEGRIVEQGTLSELRHISITTITAETSASVEGLAAIPGVHSLEYDGRKNLGKHIKFTLLSRKPLL